MRFVWSSEFKKRYKKLSKNIRLRLRERLTIFTKDAFHPILNNHRLAGRYREYRSINVGGDYRLIYRDVDEKTTYLMTIGTHAQLYE